MAKLESDLLSLNSQIVKYLSRLDSRDKLCRSVAYGSDFWAWLFTMSGSTALAAFAQHFPKIKSQVGVARKIYRIGNPLREVEAIATAQEVGLPKNMKVVMHTCNGIYYAIDTVELLCILGIAKKSQPPNSGGNRVVVMHACNGIYYAIDTVELLCILGIAKVTPPSFAGQFNRQPSLDSCQ
ncbi:peroxisomal biogenesis factor 11-domain-containing protein [Baffinella frigidus]|nr:peroxisomal biogenesis factor 11-domain-containing protein [Cryptophyta sp. CCMP2293]